MDCTGASGIKLDWPPIRLVGAMRLLGFLMPAAAPVAPAAAGPAAEGATVLVEEEGMPGASDPLALDPPPVPAPTLATDGAG